MKYIDDAETLEELIFQALGAASACWDNLVGAGEFQSSRARDIGNELIERLKALEDI